MTTREKEIQNIMMLMCIPYTLAVELYHEFNQTEGKKNEVFVNV